MNQLLAAVPSPKTKISLLLFLVLGFYVVPPRSASAQAYADLPPYASPSGSLAGASAEQLWQIAQKQYRANDHHGAALVARQAAMAGSLIAIYEIGYMYENGDGVPRRDDEALRWFKYGAAKGGRECERALGAYYEAGGSERPENFELAFQYYESAASKEYPDASYDLARMYEYGLGVPLDLGRAVNWYARAAQQGDARATERKNNLLDLYLRFDDTFATTAERDLFVDEGPRLVPTGRAFHSLAERMAYLQQHAGVKKNALAAAELRDLDNQAILAQQQRNAAEWGQLSLSDRERIVQSRQDTARRYFGLKIWQQSNAADSAPGRPF